MLPQEHAALVIFDEKRTSVGEIKKALSKCGCPAEGDPVFLK